MNVAAKPRMTVTEFLTWAEAQPEGRYELVDGEVVKISPERVGHVAVKYAVWLALKQAIARAGLDCEVWGDGVTLRIDEHTAREPDALVRCGPPLDRQALVADSPVVVIEVISPTSGRSDTQIKLVDYFSLASVQHCLILDPDKRTIIHHARRGDQEITTRIVTAGDITLDPPGLRVPVGEMFS